MGDHLVVTRGSTAPILQGYVSLPILTEHFWALRFLRSSKEKKPVRAAAGVLAEGLLRRTRPGMLAIKALGLREVYAPN